MVNWQSIVLKCHLSSFFCIEQRWLIHRLHQGPPEASASSVGASAQEGLVCSGTPQPRQACTWECPEAPYLLLPAQGHGQAPAHQLSHQLPWGHSGPAQEVHCAGQPGQVCPFWAQRAPRPRLVQRRTWLLTKRDVVIVFVLCTSCRTL